MSVPMHAHWASELRARRELARLAPTILTKTILIVFVSEFAVMMVLQWLGVPWGLWLALLDAVLLSFLITLPLYLGVFRPAAELAARTAAAPAEARFQAVVQAINDAIVVTELDGSICFSNPAVRNLFGYEPQELLGRSLLLLLPLRWSPPRSRDDRVATTFPGALSVAAEVEGCRKDQTRFPVEISTRPVEVEERRLVVTVIRDISKRKQAERELTRLAAFANLNPNPVLECDANGQITYANPAATRLLHSLWTPDSARRVLPRDFPHLVNRCLKETVGIHGQEGVVGAQTLLWSLYPVPGTNRVHAYALDITARKQAEEALKESEERFRSVAEAASEAIILADSRGRIVSWNKSAQRLFGYREEEVLGQELVLLMPERYHEAHRQALERVRATGETRVVGKTIELHGLRKDKSEFPVELSLATWQTKEGTFYSGILRDISERKRAEEELQRSAERFRQLVEALPVATRVIQNEVVVFANSADAALFGYASPAEIVGTDAFAYVAEEEVARLREYTAQRAAGEPAPTRYEFQAKRSDGTVFPVEIMVTRITYGGQPASLAVLCDLSEHKRLRLFELLLPVCSVCGKVRDDTGTERGQGTWRSLQEYVVDHSEASLSHTFCPDCYRVYRQQEGLAPKEPRQGGHTN